MLVEDKTKHFTSREVTDNALPFNSRQSVVVRCWNDTTQRRNVPFITTGVPHLQTRRQQGVLCDSNLHRRALSVRWHGYMIYFIRIQCICRGKKCLIITRSQFGLDASVMTSSSPCCRLSWNTTHHNNDNNYSITLTISDNQWLKWEGPWGAEPPETPCC